MERVDCEKCVFGYFEGDKIRCPLEKCQPEYEDMKEAKQALLDSFPGSFINDRNEFIAHRKSNAYFLLDDCEYPEDIDCKVLEWLSRSASKGMPYHQEWRNKEYRKNMLNCINMYLDTSFSEEDIDKIYTYLGNAIHHKKTKQFIRSQYDMNVLTQ